MTTKKENMEDELEKIVDKNERRLWNNWSFNAVIKKTVLDCEHLFKRELKSLKEEIIKEIKDIKNKKFAVGERRWCIKCSDRIIKEIINNIK